MALGLGSTGVVMLAFLHGGLALGFTIALLQILVVLCVALALSDRSILLFAAVGLTLIGGPFLAPVALSGDISIYAADVLVFLAFLAWIPGRLVNASNTMTWQRSKPAVLNWAFMIFAIAIFQGIMRGHDRYDASILGQPLRLVLYAAIFTTVMSADPRKIYRGIVIVFYAGAAWQAVIASKHLALGTSGTQAESLSTGGTRVVALSVSLYFAGALFLALLNLEFDRLRRWRLLHIAIAGISLIGIILAFGRGTFIAVAVVVSVMVVAFPRVRKVLTRLAPIWLPVAILGVMALGRSAPDIGPTLASRITSPVYSDRSVGWRQVANQAVWEQVEDSPVTGVGFGRLESFTFRGQFYSAQDPHNSFLYILAGAGAVALGAFLAMLATFVRDVWRRYRTAAHNHERLILIWATATLFTFLLNALVEPLLTWPAVLLTIWVLFFLPTVVPFQQRMHDGSTDGIVRHRG